MESRTKKWTCPFGFTKTIFEGEKLVRLPDTLDPDELADILDSDNPNKHKFLQVSIAKIFVHYFSKHINSKNKNNSSYNLHNILNVWENDNEWLYTYIMNEIANELKTRYPIFTKQEDPYILHQVYHQSRKMGIRTFLQWIINFPYEAIIRWLKPLISITIEYLKAYIYHNPETKTFNISSLEVPKFMVQVASLWNQYSWLFKLCIDELGGIQNAIDPKENYGLTSECKKILLKHIQVYRISSLFDTWDIQRELPDATIYGCPAISELKIFMTWILDSIQEYCDMKS